MDGRGGVADADVPLELWARDIVQTTSVGKAQGANGEMDLDALSPDSASL